MQSQFILDETWSRKAAVLSSRSSFCGSSTTLDSSHGVSLNSITEFTVNSAAVMFARENCCKTQSKMLSTQKFIGWWETRNNQKTKHEREIVLVPSCCENELSGEHACRSASKWPTWNQSDSQKHFLFLPTIVLFATFWGHTKLQQTIDLQFVFALSVYITEEQWGWPSKCIVGHVCVQPQCTAGYPFNNISLHKWPCCLPVHETKVMVWMKEPEWGDKPHSPISETSLRHNGQKPNYVTLEGRGNSHLFLRKKQHHRPLLNSCNCL